MRVVREEGYRLDDFVVGADQVDYEYESGSEDLEEDEQAADGLANSSARPRVLEPRTPKKPEVSKGVIDATKIKGRKVTTEGENLYDLYDSESLDALLGAETDKSAEESDYSNFLPDGSSDDDKKVTAKKLKRKTAVKNKKPPTKVRTAPAAEASPPSKKRAREDSEEDNDGAKEHKKVKSDNFHPILQKSENPHYRKLIDMFGLSSPPQKKRK